MLCPLFQQADLGFCAIVDLLLIDGQVRSVMDCLREPFECQVVFKCPVIGHERAYTLSITFAAFFAVFLETLFNLLRSGAEVFHGSPTSFRDIWPISPLHVLQASDLRRAVRHHIHVSDTCRRYGDLALGRVFSLQNL